MVSVVLFAHTGSPVAADSKAEELAVWIAVRGRWDFWSVTHVGGKGELGWSGVRDILEGILFPVIKREEGGPWVSRKPTAARLSDIANREVRTPGRLPKAFWIGERRSTTKPLSGRQLQESAGSWFVH